MWGPPRGPHLSKEETGREGPLGWPLTIGALRAPKETVYVNCFIYYFIYFFFIPLVVLFILLNLFLFIFSFIVAFAFIKDVLETGDRQRRQIKETVIELCSFAFYCLSCCCLLKPSLELFNKKGFRV